MPYASTVNAAKQEVPPPVLPARQKHSSLKVVSVTTALRRFFSIVDCRSCPASYAVLLQLLTSNYSE